MIMAPEQALDPLELELQMAMSHHECWESDHRPLGEKPVILTPELSLYP